jgi:isoleucyl-tRNA synthetase
MNAGKEAAYQTLFECLMVAGQLSASLAPFFADWLYQNLTASIREKAKTNNTPLRHESVHLTDIAKPDASRIDMELEQRMDYAQRISSLLLSLRKRERIRVRQPLQKIMLPVLDERFISQIEGVKDLILAEVNVKEIEYVTDTSGVIHKKIKPNFKTLGRRLGKQMKDAAAIINAISQDDIAAIESSGNYVLNLGSERHELTLEDFEITAEDVPGWLIATDGPLTVALDVTLTDELRAEGTARELVNRIQNIRKNSDFNVTDKISVRIEQHPGLKAAVDQFGDYIKGETLATSLALTDAVDGEKVELFEDLAVGIEVTLVKQDMNPNL